jgi:sarcosine oxidase subunit alpha
MSSTARARPATNTNGGATSPRDSGSWCCATPSAMKCSPHSRRVGAQRVAGAMMYRSEAQAAEWLDRSTVLRFTFEGRDYQGYSGDTISSALAAAGVPYLARSFKYHRPRSILSFANHDSNTLFQVDGVPNVRGDVTLLRDGMRVIGDQHLRRPRPRQGAGARSPRTSPAGGLLLQGISFQATVSALGAHVPRAHGSGRSVHGRRAPRHPQALRILRCAGGRRGTQRSVGCAGGGGGRCASGPGRGIAAARVPRRGPPSLLQAVHDSPAIVRYPATVAAGYYADHWVALAHSERMTKMRAKAVVFATGVIEQPAVFRNNDLPGVMLASAALRLLARHGVAPGRRVVMVAANLEAYVACLELHARGVADRRHRRSARRRRRDRCGRDGLRRVGRRDAVGACPYEAVRGADGGVAALLVAPSMRRAGSMPARRGASSATPCSMSVGWAAAAQLLLQAGGRTRFSDELQQFVPAELPPGIFAAGRMNGVYEVESRMADGRRAGSQAAAHAGFGTPAGAISGAPSGTPGGAGRLAACRAARLWRAVRAVRRIPSPSSIIRRPRISSTSTKTCRSRIWKTPRRKDSIQANCSSATARWAWVPRRASIRQHECAAHSGALPRASASKSWD